jgi:hypothetical protein
MKKTIVLTFTAAALLMAAAVALDAYGSEIFDSQWAAAEGLPRFVIYDCFGEQLRSWESPSLVCGWLSIVLSTAGVKLCGGELRARRQRASLLGLDAGTPRRMARAAALVESATVADARPRAARPLSLHGDDGLTPLERVIRGS